MLLSPPINDRMSRNRRDPFPKEHRSTAATEQLARAATLLNTNPGVAAGVDGINGRDGKKGDGHDHDQDHHGQSHNHHRRSLASTKGSRSSRRLGLGRANSMRHFRQSNSKKKSIDPISISDHNDLAEPDSNRKESSLAMDQPSRRDSKRRSKSKRELLGASDHSKVDRVKDKKDYTGSTTDNVKEQPEFVKSSLHERKDRRAMMSRSQSTRIATVSTRSSHEDLLSSKSSHGDPSSLGDKPKFTRRSSLSNFTNKLRIKSEGKGEEQTAALRHTMSKPKATGPYEGIALIQCDFQVHGGAELVAKHRSIGKRSSNPFIEVWKNLPSVMVGKTKTISKTLSPTYDESFYMQWDEKALSRCLNKNHQAKITLKIWDSDRISGHEAMGEVTVPVPLPDECPTVNRNWFLVDKDSARNATGRLQISMNVMYVKTEQPDEANDQVYC